MYVVSKTRRSISFHLRSTQSCTTSIKWNFKNTCLSYVAKQYAAYMPLTEQEVLNFISCSLESKCHATLSDVIVTVKINSVHYFVHANVATSSILSSADSFKDKRQGYTMNHLLLNELCWYRKHCSHVQFHS